jgi:O-antigen ligase
MSFKVPYFFGLSCVSFLEKIVLFVFVFSMVNAVSNAMYNIAFGLLVAFLLYAFVVKKSKPLAFPERGIQVPYWIFFFAIFLASVLLGDMPSVQKSVTYFQYSLAFWLLYLLCMYDFSKLTIHLAMASSMLFVCSYALYLRYGLHVGTRLTGFAPHPNQFAMYLILTLPFLIMFLLYERKEDESVARRILKYFTGMVIVLILGDLVLTASRGAMLGLSIGAAFIFLLQYFWVERHKCGELWKKIGILIVSIGILFGCLSATQAGLLRNDGGDRLLLFQSSYAMWMDNKWVGVGLKNWQQSYQTQYILPEAVEKDLNMPHNTTIYFFSTTGLVGGMGFIIFNVGIFIFLCKKMKQQPQNFYLQAMMWSFIAINVHGLVDSALLVRSVLQLYCGLLGIASAASKNYNLIETTNQLKK